MDMLDEEEDEK